MRQTGNEKIQTESITRFSRSQLVQLILLGALVYVAYPFISTVPTFFNSLARANWWWALLGLAISASTYVGAAAALWASADESVNFWRLSIAQVANTFAATTTPAGVGGLALSTRILQKSGLSTTRATTAVALQQSMQVIMHIVLLIFFSTAAGAGTDLSHFVPKSTMLYLIAGVALGIIGIALLVPNLRRWLSTAVTPKLKEIVIDIIEVAREPRRMALIVLGCTGTTLGAALALWTSVEAFGGNATFVTVTVVTMVGGTLASAAPTPGGVGAVEAALIGGLAAFGLPAAVSVPVGAAVSGADLLVAGVHRLAGDAVADPQRHGLRTREVADGDRRVASPGDCEADRSESAVRDDRSVRRTLHPPFERSIRIRVRSAAPVNDLAGIAGLEVARIEDPRSR